jgi:CubicO group peptidase (beta-lactamase class C family)
MTMTAADHPSDLDGFLRRHLDLGTFPGAVLMVAEGGRLLASSYGGRGVVEPESIAIREDTLFDLSSLTKPLVTALLGFLLQDDGILRFSDPVAEFVPKFAGNGRERIRMIDLLLHRSGLPAWAPLYIGGGGPAGLIDRLMRLPLSGPPGRQVAYSCPGFILLGEALREVTGRDLQQLFEDRVAAPLGLRHSGFRPPAALRHRTAATERGSAWERGMAGEAGNSFFGWRRAIIWGEVHDGNAHGLDGISGNAGLFSTAPEIMKLAGEFAGSGLGLVTEAWRRELRRNGTAGLDEARSPGWQLAATPGSAAHGVLPDDSFGHTGFTGVSLWIEPGRARVYLMLTNRIHPVARAIDMNAVRREFHREARAL